MLKNKILIVFLLVLILLLLVLTTSSSAFSVDDSELDITVDFGDIDLLDYTFVTRFYTDSLFLSMHQYHVYSMPRSVDCYPSEDGSAISFRTSADFTYYHYRYNYKTGELVSEELLTTDNDVRFRTTIFYFLFF